MAATTCTVGFLPSGLKVEVPKGIALLDAARKAGVYVSSVCGGDGICGKCKLVVDAGEVRGKPTTLLSRDEVRQNVVLACETAVLGDVSVTVPAEHELAKGPILIEADAHRFSQLPGTPSGEGRYRRDPIVKKLFLQIPEATVESGLAHHERPYAAIRKHMDAPIMQTGHKILQQLPAMIRSTGGELTATVGLRGGTVEVMQLEAGDTSRHNFAFAVDVGTTTIVAHLLSLCSATRIDAEATYNSQMKYGEDYIRRIMYADEHDALGELHACLVKDVNDLVAELVARNNVNLHDVTAVLCAGNTAMMHFLLELDPAGIRKEPYVPIANAIPPLRAAEVGLKIDGRGLLYCLPSVAAYVGSDITAGVVATGVDRSEGTCLFVDIGTNGEVVLGNRDWLACASSSAGPAFEGAGVKNGMRAAPGAIEKFTIGRDRTIHFRTIGNLPPRGLCGSGLLDVIASLYTAGLIGRNGKFTTVARSWDSRLREGEEGPELTLAEPEDRDDVIVITQPDVLNLIRSKAGVYAAVSLLMEETGTKREDLQCVYLAGGFGNYLDVSKAVAIGMLPKIPAEKVRFVGNTAIAGAKMALLSREAHDRIHEVASSMTYFDLMSNPRYMEQFVKANFIPHTDVEDW